MLDCTNGSNEFSFGNQMFTVNTLIVQLTDMIFNCSDKATVASKNETVFSSMFELRPQNNHFV